MTLLGLPVHRCDSTSSCRAVSDGVSGPRVVALLPLLIGKQGSPARAQLMASRMSSALADLGRKPSAPRTRASWIASGATLAETSTMRARGQAWRKRCRPSRPLMPGSWMSSRTRSASAISSAQASAMEPASAIEPTWGWSCTIRRSPVRNRLWSSTSKRRAVMHQVLRTTPCCGLVHLCDGRSLGHFLDFPSSIEMHLEPLPGCGDA